MPIIVAVDHEQHQVNVVAIGPITRDDAVQQLVHQARGGALSYPAFVDVRGAGVLITPEENREVAEKFREYARRTPLGPMAFVVSSDAAAETIGVLVQLVGDAVPLRVFRVEQEARDWLRAQSTR